MCLHINISNFVVSVMFSAQEIIFCTKYDFKLFGLIEIITCSNQKHLAMKMIEYFPVRDSN